MEIAVEIKIPFEQLEAADGDAARLVFERFLAEAYRTEQLSHAEIGRILGFQTPMQVDEFLKTHGVYNVTYTQEELEREAETSRYLASLRASQINDCHLQHDTNHLPRQDRAC